KPAAVTFTVNAISNRLQILSGDHQGAPINKPMPSDLTIKVTDANGTAVAGVPVSYALTSLPPGASGANLNVRSLETRSDGTASAQFFAGDKRGNYGVTATCPTCSAPNTVTFTEFASDDITVSLAAFIESESVDGPGLVYAPIVNQISGGNKRIYA